MSTVYLCEYDGGNGALCNEEGEEYIKNSLYCTEHAELIYIDMGPTQDSVSWHRDVYRGSSYTNAERIHINEPETTTSYKPKKQKSTILAPRCYTTHGALDLGENLVIYGGSCLSPVVLDASVYIGFEKGMQDFGMKYPWVQGDSVPFSIPDRNAPTDKANFRQLVLWTVEQLKDGRKVHAGCIGGHGRTGTFFAALVAHLGLTEDPIPYVRENYCNNAVESPKQMEYLVKEWGCKPARPRDGYATTKGSAPAKPQKRAANSTQAFIKPARTNHRTPVLVKGQIWGVHLRKK